MAHLVRLRTDDKWVNGPLVLNADFQAIDQNTFLAINGDDGGLWSPAPQIIIGGAGMWAAGPWTMVTTSQAQTLAGTGKRIVHGDSDYFVLSAHSGSSRHIQCGGEDFFAIPSYFSIDVTYNAPKAAIVGGRILWPMRVHHGAKLVTATLSYFIGQSHVGGLPAVLPTYRAYKADANGVITGLGLALSDPSGWVVLATPATAAAYYNSGAAKTLTYTFDANTIADVQSFTYWFELIDESGANSQTLNVFADIDVSISTIADLRIQ